MVINVKCCSIEDARKHQGAILSRISTRIEKHNFVTAGITHFGTGATTTSCTGKCWLYTTGHVQVIWRPARQGGFIRRMLSAISRVLAMIAG